MIRLRLKSCGFVVCALAISAALSMRGAAKDAPAADILIADFEGPTYGDWKATGTAFDHGPASGPLARKLELDNFRGNGVATTKIDGDGPTGTLTSPSFKIERHYISFLISGGAYEHDTCLNLLIDGRVVHSATGWNNVHMVPASWDVSKLIGKMAQVQIVDQATGDWGHIDVDQIVQTDHPERLPVATEPLYQEAFRPQFHFTARQWTVDRLNPGMRQEGWLNDLNGLIYYDSEYHLFAQRWNKCWIHAVSRDLVHWTELEPAFWEEKPDSGVQSGTCVVDYDNTSGLSPDKATPPMVVFWSRNDNRSQCISYSLDHGRTWKFYEKNPILDHPNRDPKVFWYAPDKHWVMMLYGDNQYHVLTSDNLLEWKDQHKPIPNCYECPDFFELPVDGNCLAAYALLEAGTAIRDQRLDPRHDPSKWLFEGMKRYAMHGRYELFARALRAQAMSLSTRPEDREILKADAYWLICVCDGGEYAYQNTDPPGIVTPILGARPAAAPDLTSSVSRILDKDSTAGGDGALPTGQPDYSKPKPELGQDRGALIVRAKTFTDEPRGVTGPLYTQYALMGVLAAAEAGIEVPRAYWAAVNGRCAFHLELDGDAFDSLANCMMTDEYLEGAPRVGRSPFSPAVEKGLARLERDDQTIVPARVDTYHGGAGLYGMSRLASVSGFKHFGTHDWYPEGARMLIDEQAPDGHWGKSFGGDQEMTALKAKLINTAFCVSFLAWARHPIILAKLRFDGLLPDDSLPGADSVGMNLPPNAKLSDLWKGYWNNRPRDAANLARFASKRLERQFGWEVLNIDRNWDQWLDAPVLELASNTPPQFTDAQIDKLRSYILAGGLLFTHADAGSPQFNKYAAHLAHQLFPQYELVDVPPAHPLYTNDTTFNVNPRPPLKMVSNGSRILMLHSPTDIARWWQARDDVRHKSEFELGVNIFVYAAGKQDFRNRLQETWVRQPSAKPLDTMKVARVTYGGNWSPEPWAWLRYGNWLQKKTGTCIDTYAVPVSQLRTLDPAQVPLAQLTGTAKQNFSAADAAQVRAYVQAGGVLLVDTCGGTGSFDRSAEALLAAAFPGEPLQMLPLGHPLLKKGNLGTEDVTHPLVRAETVTRYGRGVGALRYIASGKGHVLYTPLDITSGLLGIRTLGILGYEPAYAEALVKNIIFWTLDGQRDR